MSKEKVIEHWGNVREIKDGIVSVNILSQSACSSCHAKGACSASDMEEKVIEVVDSQTEYKIGETVKVYMKESLGFKALFLGYILPFLVILTTLIIVSYFTNSEAIIGLSALGLLPVYYGILYLLKDKIRQNFSFNIQKLG